MAMHAASTTVQGVVAITLSALQAALVRDRVRVAGLVNHVEVRAPGLPDLRGETSDAVSSIGMFEHVGTKKMDEYFATLFALLALQVDGFSNATPFRHREVFDDSRSDLHQPLCLPRRRARRCGERRRCDAKTWL